LLLLLERGKKGIQKEKKATKEMKKFHEFKHNRQLTTPTKHLYGKEKNEKSHALSALIAISKAIDKKHTIKISGKVFEMKNKAK